MKKFNFAKKRIAVCISAIIASGITSQVFAQETEASEEEVNEKVIEIVGIRGSLTRSVEMKRNAIGVVDVISSEDIGKFPDTNLAESLQRITGV
ncbi:MAG: hypothetical protein OQJ89_12190, partial [Kangiellaceae bacterium]|nr:hypothetical protein [Kangiellaceae bacterium]